jgi:hypothetical protein
MQKTIIALSLAVCSQAMAFGDIYVPPPVCAPPTLAECQTATYYTSYCGVLGEANRASDANTPCNLLLQQHFQATFGTLPLAEAVTAEVTNTAGQVTPGGEVRGVRIDRSVEAPVVFTGQAGTVYGPVLAKATAVAGFDEPLLMAEDPRAVAAVDTITSCEEYARRRFQDYTEFDDAAAELEGDFRGIFELAYTPGALAIGHAVVSGAGLQDSDGRPMGSFWPTGTQPKNSYFQLPVFDGVRPARAGVPHLDPGDGSLDRLRGVIVDAPLAQRLAAGRADHVESFAWHAAQSAALAPHFIDEQLELFDRKGAEFEEKLAHRAILVANAWTDLQIAFESFVEEESAACMAAYPPPGTGPNFPIDLYEERLWAACGEEGTDVLPEVERRMRRERTRVNDRLAAFDATLLTLVAQAQADGCLTAGVVAPCDWSPSRFVRRLTATFGAAREEAHQACLDFTRDDFASMTQRTLRHPITHAVLASGDFTTSLARVEQFQAVSHQIRSLLVAGIDGASLDPNGGDPMITGGASDGADVGNDLFSVGYGYDMTWRAYDLRHNALCNLNAEFDGRFDAHVAIRGRHKELIGAAARVSSEAPDGGSAGNLMYADIDVAIFDQELVDFHRSFGQESYDFIDDGVEQTHDLFEPISAPPVVILGFPVTVTVGATGTVGADYTASGRINRGAPGNCSRVSAHLEGGLVPYAGVDAYATAVVDAFIAAIGIKGEVALLHARLPFNLSLEAGADSGAVQNLQFIVRSKLDVALRTLDGKLSVYGRLGVCPFCAEAQKTFFRWSGMERSWNLLDQQFTVNLSALAGWFSNPI